MSEGIGPEVEAPGQESFLDVVANLVGILVILVMVIGVRTRDSISRAPLDAEPTDGTMEQIERLVQETQERSLATRQTAREIERIQREARLRQLERDRLQVLLVAAQRQAEATAPSEARLHELRAQLEDARDQLRIAQQKLEAAESQVDEPVVLHHTPTPLARTVFGHEEHFRLCNGYLAHVPMDEMVAELKRVAARKIAQLESVPQMTETIGPIGGFHIRYSLRRRQIVVQTEAGALAREIAELAWFELLPEREPLGEPVEQSLADDSQLARLAAQWEPSETIVTLWTYPTDFDDFRRVKDYLQAKGFLVAGRPLPEGQPITGSPEGTRSAAQ